jgi:hypothetical protein
MLFKKAVKTDSRIMVSTTYVKRNPREGLGFPLFPTVFDIYNETVIYE